MKLIWNKLINKNKFAANAAAITTTTTKIITRMQTD